jgi:hypothetical protein
MALLSTSDPSSTKFQYSSAPLSLSTQSIRLVSLQRNERSSKPTCVLRSYAVDGPHTPYTALSYAWGENIPYNDILLNRHSFPVAQNLWSFLTQMTANEDFTTLFWVDAICIDQTNVQERNHQVQMMRQIYSSAESVLVWLGEPDTTGVCNVAMDYLSAREPLRVGYTSFRRFWTRRQASAVLALCHQSYWTRIWIVQEVLLAKQIVIHYGWKAISWHHLQQFFEDVAVIYQRSRELPAGISPVNASPAAIIVKAKTDWIHGGPQPLMRLITRCVDHRATDIRDKIYALHGLASDTDNLAIDYNLSLLQLLQAVLRHTCTTFGEREQISKSRKKLLRFGRILQGILQVGCGDDELKAIIDEAEDIQRANEVRARARGARHAVMTKARFERPWSTSRTSRMSGEGTESYVGINIDREVDG